MGNDGRGLWGEEMKYCFLFIGFCLVFSGCSSPLGRATSLLVFGVAPTGDGQYVTAAGQNQRSVESNINNETEYEMQMRLRQQTAENAKNSMGSDSCGIVKPIPDSGCKITRCFNGQWEQTCTGAAASVGCGFEPIPAFGCRIGNCVNGEWEQICN